MLPFRLFTSTHCRLVSLFVVVSLYPSATVAAATIQASALTTKGGPGRVRYRYTLQFDRGASIRAGWQACSMLVLVPFFAAMAQVPATLHRSHLADTLHDIALHNRR